MPKVWLVVQQAEIYSLSLEPVEDAFEVEIKASTYKNIKRTGQRFWTLQVVLDRWYHQAKHKGIRRFL